MFLSIYLINEQFVNVQLVVISFDIILLSKSPFFTILNFGADIIIPDIVDVVGGVVVLVELVVVLGVVVVVVLVELVVVLGVVVVGGVVDVVVGGVVVLVVVGVVVDVTVTVDVVTVYT